MKKKFQTGSEINSYKGLFFDKNTLKKKRKAVQMLFKTTK
jgi:hypothetical protein